MNIFILIVLVAWIVFCAYWLISARGVKKIVRQTNPWWRVGISILFAVSVIFFTQQASFAQRFFPRTIISDAIGVILCLGGIGIAIWARKHLGTNWSSTPSIQEGHELVTSGPYRFVRHPIYTGILLAVFGSAFVGGAIWFIYFVAVLIMFVWRVGAEESFMTELFPAAYAAYKKRTKALIPFVW